MTKERKTFQPLPSSGICDSYTLLHRQGLVAFPITADAETRIGGIVANINASYFGVDSYPTAEEKAVAYLYFLINDHPFTDGNKRTASLSFLVVCKLNDLKPVFKGFSLDELAVFLEKADGEHRDVIKAVAETLFP